MKRYDIIEHIRFLLLRLKMLKSTHIMYGLLRSYENGPIEAAWKAFLVTFGGRVYCHPKWYRERSKR